MNDNDREFFDAIFKPGQIYDAAVCVDHLTHEGMLAMGGTERVLIYRMGMSVLTILKEIEDGASVEDIGARIDRVFAIAKTPVASREGAIL